MSTPAHASEQSLRISTDDLRHHLESGEAVTLLDARNEQSWRKSPEKMAGAVRVRPDDWHIDPSWPKDRLTVVY